jgi:hypothetical protein
MDLSSDGEPRDLVTWFLMPLFFALHVMGELIKPVSLSLRLFGNIFRRGQMLAAFLGMAWRSRRDLAQPAPSSGCRCTCVFLPGVDGSTIQATVFALLAAVYITLLLPHEHARKSMRTRPAKLPPRIDRFAIRSAHRARKNDNSGPCRASRPLWPT